MGWFYKEFEGDKMLRIRSLCTVLMVLWLGVQGSLVAAQPPSPPPPPDITAARATVPSSRQLRDMSVAADSIQTDGEASAPLLPPSPPMHISTQPTSTVNYGQLLTVLLAPFNVTVAQIGEADAGILMATMVQISANITIVGEAAALARSPHWLGCSTQAVLCGVRTSPLCNGGAIALSTVTAGGLCETLVSGGVLSHAFLVVATALTLLAACMKASAVCLDSASAANGPADMLAAVLVAILKKHQRQ
jgi:hypothetical protein